MRGAVAVVLALALGLASLAASLAACGSGGDSGADTGAGGASAVRARVIRAVDGDTALVRLDGRTVRLVFDRERHDVYGRLLAYVYVGGRFVNAALVRGGYARTDPFPPNTAHAALFARLAERAGRRGRGLWGRC